MPAPGGSVYTFYVDYQNGNDTTGDGSYENPYKTIDRALTEPPETPIHDCFIYIKPCTYYINTGSVYDLEPTKYSAKSFGREGHFHIEGLPDENGAFPRIVVDFRVEDNPFYHNSHVRFVLNDYYPDTMRYIGLKRLVFVFRGRPTYYGTSFIYVWGGVGTRLIEQCMFIGHCYVNIDPDYPLFNINMKALCVGSIENVYVRNCLFFGFAAGVLFDYAYYAYVQGCIFQKIKSVAIILEPNMGTADHINISYNNFVALAEEYWYAEEEGYGWDKIVENNTITDPDIYSKEAVKFLSDVPMGIYPVIKERWTASDDVNEFGSSGNYESRAINCAWFNYVVGDCGDTVYIETTSAALSIDADVYKYLMLEAVVQMVSGDDNNNPFIEYKIGETWYRKSLAENLFYVFDSALSIWEEAPVNAYIDMSAEEDWAGTVIGFRFGGWEVAKGAQEPRNAYLLNIIPVAYDDILYGRQEQLNDDSPAIDTGNPDIFDSYSEEFGFLGKGGQRSDQGAYGGGSAEPLTGFTSTRLGYLTSLPEYAIRLLRASTEGIFACIRGLFVQADEAAITSVGFESMSERLLEAGDMHKTITGQTLQSVACDNTVMEFSDHDSALYDELNTKGLLYPKIFAGTLTDAFENILTDTSQDLSQFTLAGYCEILSGDAAGKRYFIIFNDATSWTVLPDPDDIFSVDPQTDGVVAGDSYKIDASYEIWAQIRVGFQGIPQDRILWMGGYVNQKDIEHSIASRSVLVDLLGFEKLLESYDAYEVCSDEKNLFFIPGIKVLKYFPGTQSSITYGPRSINFMWQDGQIEGVEIDKIQLGNSPGLKILEFRPPTYFRYNGGEWTSIEGEQTEFLSDLDGNQVSFKFSGKYPNICAVMFFTCKGSYSPYLDVQGMPTLQLGDGPEISLNKIFTAVLLHEGNTWTDLTNIVTYGRKSLGRGQDYASCFTGPDAEIYFLSAEPFTGIELILHTSTSFSSQVSYLYCAGGTFYNSFSNYELEDATENLSQDGTITWNLPTDWVRSRVSAGSLGNFNAVYVVKIRRDTFAGGNLSIERLFKAFRIYDQDSLGVDVAIDVDSIPWEDSQDAVIIRKGGLIGTWYNNIDFHTLAERAADIFGYPTACRLIEEMRYSWSSPKIGIWGRLPYSGGIEKTPTALCWDSQTSILYVGYQDELWEIPQKGPARKLMTLPKYNNFTLYIYRMEVVHTQISFPHNTVRCVAWKPHDAEYTFDTEPLQELDYDIFWANSPAVAFSYDISEISATLYCELNTISAWDDVAQPGLFPGDVTLRQGSLKEYTIHPPDNWIYTECLIGQGAGDAYFMGALAGDSGHDRREVWPVGAGENIVSPLGKNNWMKIGPFGLIGASPFYGNTVLRLQGGLYSQDSFPTGIAEGWYFRLSKTLEYPDGVSTFGPAYEAPPGWYSVIPWAFAHPDSPGNYYNFMWKLGQPGYVVWDELEHTWIGRVWDGNPSKVVGADLWYDRRFSASGINFTVKASNAINTSATQTLHADWDDTLAVLYACQIYWKDEDAFNPDVWAISQAKIQKINVETGDVSTAWDFHGGISLEVGSSIVGIEQPFVMPIEIKYDAGKGVFHGCILSRITLKYHYMIFDPVNSKLYSILLTENPNYQIKSFVYCSTDSKMYFAVCDVRYNKVGATIYRASFDVTRPKGDWVVFEKVGSVDDTEWDIPQMIVTSGRIMGFTGPTKGYIFQIDDEFYPRVQYADLSDLNGRQLFEHLCSPLTMRMRVGEDNVLNIKNMQL